MANFNFVIDCDDEMEAAALHEFIQGLDFHHQELEVEGEQVNLVSKQGLLPELERWANEREAEISIEVYPEGIDFDEAEESDQVEYHSYGSQE